MISQKTILKASITASIVALHFATSAQGIECRIDIAEEGRPTETLRLYQGNQTLNLTGNRPNAADFGTARVNIQSQRNVNYLIVDLSHLRKRVELSTRGPEKFGYRAILVGTGGGPFNFTVQSVKLTFVCAADRARLVSPGDPFYPEPEVDLECVYRAPGQVRYANVGRLARDPSTQTVAFFPPNDRHVFDSDGVAFEQQRKKAFSRLTKFNDEGDYSLLEVQGTWTNDGHGYYVTVAEGHRYKSQTEEIIGSGKNGFRIKTEPLTTNPWQGFGSRMTPSIDLNCGKLPHYQER